MLPNIFSNVVSLGIPSVQGCQLMGLRVPMNQRITQMILQIVCSDLGQKETLCTYCPQAGASALEFKP